LISKGGPQQVQKRGKTESGVMSEEHLAENLWGVFEKGMPLPPRKSFSSEKKTK